MRPHHACHRVAVGDADALQSKGNRLRHHVRRLRRPPQEGEIGGGREFSIAGHANSPCTYQRGCSLSRSCSPLDRKSVVSGKSVSVRVVLGGRRLLKKIKKTTN